MANRSPDRGRERGLVRNGVRAVCVAILLAGCASGDRPMQLLSGAGPIYPATARTAGVEGHVVLAYDITAAGVVHNVRVRESVPAGVFDEAAVVALMQWRYRPPYRGGVAQPVTNVESRIEFELAADDPYGDY